MGNGALNDRDLCTAGARERPRREENMRRQIEWNHIRRIALAAEVSPHIPAFSEHGFEKRSLKDATPALWAEIQRVFRENAPRERLARSHSYLNTGAHA